MNNNVNNNKTNNSNFLITILIIIILALGALCIYFAMKENVDSNKKNDNQNTNQKSDSFTTYVKNLERARKESSKDILTYQDVFGMSDNTYDPIYKVTVNSDGTVSVTFVTSSTNDNDESVIIGKALEQKYKSGYKLPINDVISAYFIINDSTEGDPEGFVFLKKDGTMYTINNKQMHSNHTISLTKLNYVKIISVYTAVGGGGTLQTVGIDINGNEHQMIIPVSE
jgi:hypothetical protein